MWKTSSAAGNRWMWVSEANGREDAGRQLVVNTENTRKDLWELKSGMLHLMQFKGDSPGD